MVFEPRSMFNKLVNREMNQVADSVISAVARIRIQSPSAKIYVMTLPNLTNLHAGYTYKSLPLIGGKISNVLAYAISTYNKALVSGLSGLKNIKLINSGSYLDQVAQSPIYSSSVADGSTCFNDPSGDYKGPLLGNQNCMYGKGDLQSYFSWNNAHYVSRVNKQLAKYISTEI